MMEFLLFLTSKEREILDLIYKAQYSVEENTPLCLLGEKYFGFFKKEQKTIVICTQNAMDRSGYSLPKSDLEDEFDRTGIYIRRALRHEAVHVAQNCNKGKTLGLAKEGVTKIHPYKKEALKGSTRVSGNRKKEYEAYWMEDNPKLVKSVLKKYCLKNITKSSKSRAITE